MNMVPDVSVTQDLLEDGTFLKQVISICNRNRTQLNLFRLLKILRDSWVWIPCNTIMSDVDHEAWSKIVMDALDNDDLDSLIGLEVSNQDSIRLVPDILQNGDAFSEPFIIPTEIFSIIAKMDSSIEETGEEKNE